MRTQAIETGLCNAQKPATPPCTAVSFDILLCKGGRAIIPKHRNCRVMELKAVSTAQAHLSALFRKEHSFFLSALTFAPQVHPTPERCSSPPGGWGSSGKEKARTGQSPLPSTRAFPGDGSAAMSLTPAWHPVQRLHQACQGTADLCSTSRWLRQSYIPCQVSQEI